MSGSPTLLLINGAWHRSSMWNVLRAELAEIHTLALQLPSSAPVPVAELGDLFDDGRAIRDAVDRIDGPTVVCAHSYGGAPAGQALAGLEQVLRIVYLNAFVLEVGESMVSVAGGHYKPHWDVHEDQGYVDVIDAEHVLYNDLTPSAARAAAADLGPQSLSSLIQPVTRAAWHTTDSTYIAGRLDAGVPPMLSALFASRAHRSVTMQASHSAFLSQPRELAELLRREIADAAAAAAPAAPLGSQSRVRNGAGPSSSQRQTA